MSLNLLTIKAQEQAVLVDEPAKTRGASPADVMRPKVLRMLDVWRGLACLAVVCFHIELQRRLSGGLEQEGLLNDVLECGYLGVQIFFVISGYCITGAAINAMHRGGGIAEFLPARGWRILPPYWTSLALIFLMKFVASELAARGVLGGADVPDVAPSGVAFYLANFSLTSYLFDQPLASRVAWSLCYEAAFYLMVGMVLLVVRRAGPFLWALHSLTFVSLLLMIFLGERIRYPLDLWPQFGLGVIAFDLLNNGRCRRALVSVIGGFSLIAIFIFVRDVPWPLGDTSSRTTYLVASVFCLMVLAMSRYDDVALRFRPLEWTGQVGKISYSLYLIHFPLITAAAVLLPTRASAPQWLAMLVPFLLLAAWLFFLVAERPFCRGYRRRSIAVDVKS